MFLRNRTSFVATMARGHVARDFAVVAVSIEVAVKIRGAEASSSWCDVSRISTDPPGVGAEPSLGY